MGLCFICNGLATITPRALCVCRFLELRCDARVDPGDDSLGDLRGSRVRGRRHLEAARRLDSAALLGQGGQGGDGPAHQERTLRGQRIHCEYMLLNSHAFSLEDTALIKFAMCADSFDFKYLGCFEDTL